MYEGELLRDNWESLDGTCWDEEPIPELHQPVSALDVQVEGNHYKKLKIQPMEYCVANNIPFPEGNAIKYITRWRDKGGIKDLEKAIHTLEILIELERNNVRCTERTN